LQPVSAFAAVLQVQAIYLLHTVSGVPIPPNRCVPPGDRQQPFSSEGMWHL